MPAEYLIAIALKTGRGKDFARVKMFIDQADIDNDLVKQLIQRFDLEAKWQKYQNLM